jgi:hypothetical protein
MISGFHDFASRIFSCAFQRTKPHAFSPGSDDYRSSVLEMTVEKLFPFLRAARPF